MNALKWFGYVILSILLLGALIGGSLILAAIISICAMLGTIAVTAVGIRAWFQYNRKSKT